MQLLVMIEDRVNPDDPIKHAELPKRGDVLHVAADDHRWGRDELTHTFFRVIHCPEMSEDEALAHLAGEPNVNDPKEIHRSRAFRLDLDALDSAAHKFHFRNSKHCVASLGTVKIDLETLRKIKQRKPPARHPAVIGPDKGVLGPK